MFALRGNEMKIVPLNVKDRTAWVAFDEVDKPKIQSAPMGRRNGICRQSPAGAHDFPTLRLGT